MTQKALLIIWNTVSGIFVLLFSLWMSGPGIAETETPVYRWYFMSLFVVWAIGLLLQFRGRMKTAGLIVTFLSFIVCIAILLKAALL